MSQAAAQVKVTVYTSPLCGYCTAAKRLLQEKGIQFSEINVLFDKERRQEMIARSEGRTTVPQIFVGDHHIGGCDDLYALEQSGGLEELLGDPARSKDH